MKASGLLRIACMLLVLSFAAPCYGYVFSYKKTNGKGVGWSPPTVTFAYLMFGTLPANQQATQGAFNSAFRIAAVRWNNLSKFRYKTVAKKVDPCIAPGTVSGQANSGHGWQFAKSVCGAAFGASTLAVARTWVAQDVNGNPIKIIDSDILVNKAFVFDVHNGNQNGPQAQCAPFQGQPKDLTRVFVHELGHALGLNHELANTAIMAPTYSECIWKPQLDDKKGLIALYGKKSARGGATLARPRLTVRAFAGRNLLRWTASKGARMYLVFRKTQPGKRFVRIKRTRITRMVDQKVRRGKVYWYRVIAMKGKLRSKPSNIVRVRAK